MGFITIFDVFFAFIDCLGESITKVAGDIEDVELNYPSQRWER